MLDVTLYKELLNLQFYKSIFYGDTTLQSLRTVWTLWAFNLSLTYAAVKLTASHSQSYTHFPTSTTVSCSSSTAAVLFVFHTKAGRWEVGAC